MAKPKPYGLTIIDTTISSSDGATTAGWVKLLSPSDHRTGLSIQYDPDHGGSETVLIGTHDTDDDIPETEDGSTILILRKLSKGDVFELLNDFANGQTIRNAIWVKSAGTSVPLHGFVMDTAEFFAN